ncbi:MAG: class F420-dependent oxidoreductase [Frankiales bacterium]|nr:class F420-dependent oxidoreductase [Frankiales bacterium]
MKIGIAIGNFDTFGKQGGTAEILEVARHAERLGLDSVWLHDHLFMPATIKARYPYNESGVAGFAYRQNIYDPYAMMAAVAVNTTTVQIGTSVVIVPYRNPILQARMLATLDHLSHGRIVFGLGVGWMAEEFEALGIADYYPIRGTVTDEWMRICMALWDDKESVDYEGRFHSFQGLPGMAPVQRPYLPLWVGGKGEIAARRVARYGTGYHTITSTPEELRAELVLVDVELERRGRLRSDIEVSMLGPVLSIGATGEPAPGVISGSVDQMVNQLGEYAEAGLEHAILLPRHAKNTSLQQTPAQLMEGMAFIAEEVLPALHQREPGSGDAR